MSAATDATDGGATATATPTSTTTTTGAAAGTNFSSRILGLKFMQRAKEKAHFNQDAAAAKIAATPKPSTANRPEPAIFAKNRARITVPGSRKQEIAPKAPFDGLGRWSFGGENPDVEAAHAALKEKKRKLKALARAKASNDVDVEDDQMAAAAFAKAGRSGKKKGVKRDFVKPQALGAVKRPKV